MDLPNLHQEEHFHVREDRWPQNNKEGRCRPSFYGITLFATAVSDPPPEW